MKYSIIASFVGLATATSLRGDQLDKLTKIKQALSDGGYSETITTTQYTASTSQSGTTGLKTFLPIVSVGGDANLNGVSDLAATSLGTNIGVSSGARSSSSGSSSGLSNIGTGPLLLTSASTGQSAVVSGKPITNGIYPSSNLNLSSISSNQMNSNVVSTGIINNAINEANSSFGLNLNSILSKLPSSRDIDGLILNADAVGLLKLVQTIGLDTSIPCDQRIAYLLQLNGRLKTAIQKKIFSRQQVKVVIQTAGSQIIRLESQIKQNNLAIDRLGLNDLNERLNSLTKQMQTAYSNFNSAQSQIPVIEAQILGNQKQLEIINKDSQKERNKIYNDKLKLSQVVNEMNTLQSRLKELQDQEAAVKANIAKGENNTGNNNHSIHQIRQKIQFLQNKLKGVNQSSDSQNSQIKQLQVRAGRLRTDISIANSKRMKLLKQNESINDRIAVERKKNVVNDLQKLNIMITNLKSLIPSLQSEVDRHFYYCFGNGKVQVQKTNGLLVYIVRGDAFGNYLRNLYGRNVVVPAVNGDVLFNKVDIFGPSWTGAFGYPFLNSSLGGNDFSFAGSFGCTNPTSITTGSGVISALGSNWIQFTDGNGKMHKANLGSCSRLQSTRKLPVVGQKFFWSGVPASQGFNLYSASCFD